MPNYRFHIENGRSEDFILALPDDSRAVEEGLKTAAGFVGDLSLPHTGTRLHVLEVTEGDTSPLLEIRIQAVRSR